MRKIGSTLLLLLMLVLMQASGASAAEVKLPLLIFLAGETQPVEFRGTFAEGHLETVGGAALSNPKGTVTAEKCEEKLPSGFKCTFKADFEGVKEAGTVNECNTKGDNVAGLVLLSGEVLSVAIEPAAGGKVAGLQFKFEELTLLCGKKPEEGKTKIKVKGLLLLEVKPINKELLTEAQYKERGEEVKFFEVPAKCSKLGVQEFTQYFDDEEKLISKDDLETNFGLAFELGCLSIAKPVLLTPSKMGEIKF